MVTYLVRFLQLPKEKCLPDSVITVLSALMLSEKDKKDKNLERVQLGFDSPITITGITKDATMCQKKLCELHVAAYAVTPVNEARVRIHLNPAPTHTSRPLQREQAARHGLVQLV